jgi:hypothetical protein
LAPIWRVFAINPTLRRFGLRPPLEATQENLNPIFGTVRI